MEKIRKNMEIGKIYIDNDCKKIYNINEILLRKREKNMENICKFIPTSNELKEINIINFVYETQKTACNQKITMPVYRMGLVTGGNGKLKTYASEENLKTGDVFFTFPSEPFFMETDDDFEFMYISYIGIRANMISEKLKINVKKCVFHDMENIVGFWKTAIESKASDLKCESILLYTFSEIEERGEGNEKEIDVGEAAQRIREYADENFNIPTLDLKMLADKLSYSEKYISAVFKKEFKTGINDYISSLRIRYACTLMERGMTNIADIASLCGYTDPLYFSKVFKKRVGVSPKTHLTKK